MRRSIVSLSEALGIAEVPLTRDMGVRQHPGFYEVTTPEQPMSSADSAINLALALDEC